MSEFKIHDRLVTDCHRLGRLPASHLLLHRNAALHWFILVPETDLIDLLDLPPASRDALITEASAVSRFLKDPLGYPRVNVAAIGNLVPQLHLHVVGRRPDDPCWPAPVWGNLGGSTRYPAAELASLRQSLAAALDLAC